MWRAKSLKRLRFDFLQGSMIVKECGRKNRRYQKQEMTIWNAHVSDVVLKESVSWNLLRNGQLPVPARRAHFGSLFRLEGVWRRQNEKAQPLENRNLEEQRRSRAFYPLRPLPVLPQGQLCQCSSLRGMSNPKIQFLADRSLAWTQNMQDERAPLRTEPKRFEVDRSKAGLGRATL